MVSKKVQYFTIKLSMESGNKNSKIHHLGTRPYTGAMLSLYHVCLVWELDILPRAPNTPPLPPWWANLYRYQTGAKQHTLNHSVQYGMA